MTIKKLSLTFLFAVTAVSSLHIEARSGSGAGLFFGGLTTGAVLSSAARRNDYRSDEEYIRLLEEENADLRAENRMLQRKLSRS